LVNQIRGLLLQRGILIRKGRRHAEEALSEILEDPDTNLSWPLRTLLAQLQDELSQLQREIEQADALILSTASEHEACRRLMAIPGIGPVVATATIATVGNGADFEKGTREQAEQEKAELARPAGGYEVGAINREDTGF
jgi:transposase